MALNLGVLSAAVTLYNKDYLAKLKELEVKSDSTFQKIANMAGAYLSFRAITGFAQKSIQTFSDLEEETNKFNVVFQDMGNETSRVLSELTKNFGLSELAAKKMLAGTGDMLTGFGFDRKTALQLSEAAAKLGADLASFSNYSGGASGATTALTKAMLGETESAKMLGIVIRQDSEEFKALVEQAMTTGVRIDALGQTFYASSEQQAKAIAAMNIAYQQSPNAIGDFMRSQDSLANQTRILQNNLEEFYSTIGKDMQESFAGGLSVTNDLVKAYIELSPAARGAVNNVTILTGAMLLLGKTGLLVKANLAAGSWIRNATAAYLRLARATGISAKANVAWSMTAKAAIASANRFAASLGPIGTAMLALSAAYIAFDYQIGKINSSIESSVSSAQKEMDNAASASRAHDQLASSAQSAMERLHELAKYERLSNIEKDEAQRLITELAKIYGDLDIAIDKNTGKLVINASAWKNMNKEQRETAIKDKQQEVMATRKYVSSTLNAAQNEANNFWRGAAKNALITAAQLGSYTILGGDKLRAKLEEMRANPITGDIINAMGIYDAEKQLSALRDLRDKMLAGDIKGVERVERAIELVEKQIELEKQLKELKNSPADQPKTDAKPVAQQRQESQANRRAMESVNDFEWNIRFSQEDLNRQIDMLKDKINDIFAREASGKYNSVDDFVKADRYEMTEKELLAVKQILELRKQISDITDNSSKEAEKLQMAMEKLDDEDTHQSWIRHRKEELDAMGNAKALEYARERVRKHDDEFKMLRNVFVEEYKKALEDNIITDDELDTLRHIQEDAADLLNSKRYWQRIVDSRTISGKKDEQNAKTIGSWTLAGLASQLRGAGTPEQETAKNTKKSYDMLKEINSNIKANNNTTTGSYK